MCMWLPVDTFLSNCYFRSGEVISTQVTISYFFPALVHSNLENYYIVSAVEHGHNLLDM